MNLTKFFILLIVINVSLALAPDISSKAEPQIEYWGLLIGVSDYAPLGSGGPDLNFADDDARDMYQVLTTEHGWKSSNIIKLIDSNATKTGVQNAITSLAEKEGPNDLFLLFFAGHGAYTIDQNPIDEADGYDEYILTFDLATITDDELMVMLSVLDSSKIVTIFDCCFSGGFMKGNNIETRTLPGVQYRNLNDTLNGDLAKPGYIVLSASDDNETCAESSTLQNGIFTFYLIEGMHSQPFPADTDGDFRVSAEETYFFAKPKATALNEGQHAQIWDGIQGEAELTFHVRYLVGGRYYSPSKLTILAPYLILLGASVCCTASLLECKGIEKIRRIKV